MPPQKKRPQPSIFDTDTNRIFFSLKTTTDYHYKKIYSEYIYLFSLALYFSYVLDSCDYWST